jgi:ParB-like chromosome segregation protein Spo0J
MMTPLQMIPLRQLVPHPLNANVMPEEYLEKLAENIVRSGRYPPLITRQLEPGRFQILDGAQRGIVLDRLGFQVAACVVWDVDDTEALVLLATLNRLEGADVPGRRARLIEALAAHASLAELAKLLPEGEDELAAYLEPLDFDLDELVSRFEESHAAEVAELPVAFTFAVASEDASIVEEAIAAASAELRGLNQNGRALVLICRRYLGAEGA